MIVLDDLVPLASGGTAELFLARSHGRRVVVKVARADRAGAADALEAEASVLETLSVACAPRLLERTQVDGRSALVLEHITLPTLRSVIASASSTRSPAGDLRALATAVCEAVSRVHDAGVVHADLTPGNILVDPGSRVVRLIDFGVAARFGGELAPLATAEYAAPERHASGCRAHPTVDVYSLGVICYELFAGARPFDGSARVLRLDHTARRVPRVSERAAVPAAIDDAIARAMAKAPEARPSDAGALAAALSQGAVAVRRPPVAEARPAQLRAMLIAFTWKAGAATVSDVVESVHAVVAYSKDDRHVAVVMRGETRATAERLASMLRAAGAADVDLVEADVQLGRHGLPVSAAIIKLGRKRGAQVAPAIARPPLVGRERELAALEAAARAVVGGGTALVTVWGAVGTGKSHLAEALADKLDDFTTIQTRGSSLGELVDRLACDDLDPVDRAALFAMAGRSPATSSAAAPLAAAPGALRQAAARALSCALVARRRPVAIVVDDAHDADPVVLDALELATIEPDRGVLVIAFARPSLELTRPHWSRRAAVAEAIALEPLRGEPGRRLIRALLPAIAAVPSTALDRLVDRCGGVPLYMIELVGALQRAAGVQLVTRGALPTDLVDAPGHHEVIAWAVADELSGLAPDLRRIAESLAVAARSIAVADVARLFAAFDAADLRADLDAGVAVEQLVGAGLLVDAGDTLRFRHDLVRDEVAARVPASRRVAIHRAVLASGIALSAADFAHHAEQAGDRAAAATAWRRAAGAALGRHDHLAAELMLGRAIACSDAPAADLVRQRGGARARLGRHDAAASDFAAARELARVTGDRGEAIDVLLDEATALDWSLHQAAALACVDEAAALAADDEPPLRRARLAMARGRCAWRANDGARALAPLREAIALADGAGEDGYETAIASRLMLGFILGELGDIEAAAQILDQALAEASARGDLHHSSAARLNRYPVHAARGDAAALRHDMAALAAAGRELGIAVMEYRGELYQALVAKWCADDDAARVHATAARRLEAADATLFPRNHAALVLAELAARAGDRTAAARAIEIAQAHGSPRTIDAIVLEGLQSWVAEQLDLDRARELAERATAIGEPEAAHQLLELVARTLERCGAGARAAAARDVARATPGLPRFFVQGIRAVC